MSQHRLRLRYMQVADVPQISQVEALSFSDPWSARSYVFEINESLVSHMVVLEASSANAAPAYPWWHWRAWWQPRAARQWALVGFGGLWRMDEEGHISTIAVHPTRRGQQLGELLLLAMCIKAQRLGADYIILEVRVSNQIAIALYEKHGFVIEDRRVGYYSNPREDGYSMRLELGDGARLQAAYAALLHKKDVQDDYVPRPHPRLG